MFHQLIHEPYDIILEEKDTWESTRLPQPAFQLVYIRDGKGYHYINGNRYEYSPGKLFLVAPEDQYHCDITEATTFIIIRFTQLFITQLKDEADRVELCDWMKKTDYIFHNYHAKSACIFRDTADEAMARSLLCSIAREHQQRGKGYQLIIRQSISILLNLVARNLLMSESKDVQENSGQFSVLRMISHLQEHIYQPEMLRMPVLAETFNMSVNYLGEYFKKHTGESIQDYIISYKLKLVEIRLSYSNMRVREIAQEFGFTDESYLSRLFKKHRGITPGMHRKNTRQQQTSPA
ncbi:AraC family transcriptional regulator [Chitinophaga qingshengii]|uniref:Helix-turn-helix transcriptional regulator n=1 Tax=Chitinophaga qingshengii TaxID=1569794 RepID=A0ABR7TYC8_9BACT|nr:AraC family transcriptional regulator [Chitinophaga qingshengii]MBC9934514.1 helix-turn-helix transcriptional regulator [Chitinophaga qingshengii]